MAVDSAKPIPGAQTQDETSQDARNISKAEDPGEFDKSSRRIEVPSSLSQDDLDEGLIKDVEELHSDDLDDIEGDQPGDRTCLSLKYHQNEQEADSAAADSNPELSHMDWDDLEASFKKALEEADKEEDDLLAEFDKYMDIFQIWAVASAQHDNDRAWKRLKTRERFVQLSEASLQEKKKHYEEVVEAFKKALALLRR